MVELQSTEHTFLVSTNVACDCISTIEVIDLTPTVLATLLIAASMYHNVDRLAVRTLAIAAFDAVLTDFSL